MATTSLVHNPGRCDCGCCRSFERVFKLLYHTGTSPELRAQGEVILDRCYLQLLEVSPRPSSQVSVEVPAPGESGVGGSPGKSGDGEEPELLLERPRRCCHHCLGRQSG